MFEGFEKISHEPKKTGFGGSIILSIYWWFYELFHGKPKGYEATTKALNTPHKCQGWMDIHFKYIADKTPADEWLPPEVTYKRGGGDCEDWARYAEACLGPHYTGYYLCMYTKTEGHAIYLVDRGENKYYGLGNWGLINHKGPWENIPKDYGVFKDWTLIRVLDEDMQVIYTKRK